MGDERADALNLQGSMFPSSIDLQYLAIQQIPGRPGPLCQQAAFAAATLPAKAAQGGRGQPAVAWAKATNWPAV